MYQLHHFPAMLSAIDFYLVMLSRWRAQWPARRVRAPKSQSLSTG
ncbi:hypothetical protein SAMN05444158_6525 [Bradyrhizobium canariense]|uniref:Uncharacterized protein n=1 Tax=Bradyrhizobium canariense TaxID=255045 RepID=A0A1H2AVQ8_9BRAD|nr:hypothetical protein SAMN05444158_6525 [Bradyrhizobium canariense]